MDFRSVELRLIIVFITVNYKLPQRIQAVYLARGSNLEPIHAEQEKNYFAHNCDFHWLQRQGNNFFLRLLHESIVYWACKIAAIHIVHTISSHE